MAGFYQAFTVARTTQPDPTGLLAALRALDATAGVQHVGGTANYTVKKATAWTGPQIAAAQNTLETAPVASDQLAAQAKVDAMAIFEKAIVLTILDQFNTVRSKLVPPLANITVQQMIDAIRAKAGTL